MYHRQYAYSLLSPPFYVRAPELGGNKNLERCKMFLMSLFTLEISHPPVQALPSGFSVCEDTDIIGSK